MDEERLKKLPKRKIFIMNSLIFTSISLSQMRAKQRAKSVKKRQACRMQYNSRQNPNNPLQNYSSQKFSDKITLA